MGLKIPGYVVKGIYEKYADLHKNVFPLVEDIILPPMSALMAIRDPVKVFRLGASSGYIAGYTAALIEVGLLTIEDEEEEDE